MSHWRLLPLVLSLLASIPTIGHTAPTQDSQPAYTEWTRTSQYITMRDGVRLAADIFRPAKNGKAVEGRFPVIWSHNRYNRAQTVNGQTATMLDWLPFLKDLVKNGYVVVAVDVRGSGASYGWQRCPWPPEEALDGYDVTEWLAAQPWSTGKIGMYGLSYNGINQLLAASTAPPHLKAIFPEVAAFDMYGFFYPGGVLNSAFASNWGQGMKIVDSGTAVSRVDEDTDGKMLAEAAKEHQSNVDYYAMFSALKFRDSSDKTSDGIRFYLADSPSTRLDKISKSGIAIYHRGCWYDLFTRDTFQLYANLTNPQKMLITPGAHNVMDPTLSVTEMLRWFDYWLKGVDNGIMKEPPIRYYVLGAPKGKEWRTAEKWPLPNTKMTRYYLLGGPSGSIQSVNDGLLDVRSPHEVEGRDEYTVDYTASSGPSSRWIGGPADAFDYPDLATNDKKGLTYTTQPLSADIEVTGHPVVHLWVSSTAKDGDFFAYLESVDAQGYSHLITDGILRASHRARSRTPYKNLGLPYHRSFAKDIIDLPSEPVELVFDLQPTSRLFHAGDRIRLTITCADKDHMLTPELNPAPKVSVYRGRKMKSYVELPVIPSR